MHFYGSREARENDITTLPVAARTSLVAAAVPPTCRLMNGSPDCLLFVFQRSPGSHYFVFPFKAEIEAPGRWGRNPILDEQELIEQRCGEEDGH